MNAERVERSALHRSLPETERLTVVCAHPDDGSFGLGALIAAFTTTGTAIARVYLTAGRDLRWALATMSSSKASLG